MEKLEQIADEIHQNFDALTAARDQALTRARALTRACARYPFGQLTGMRRM